MEKYGIIDLGSNSIRLVVYRIQDPFHTPLQKQFKELISTKKTAGLSGYIRQGAMTAAGIHKAADTLEEFLKRARIVGCSRISIVATAVIRNCSNSKEVATAIEKQIHHPIDVISGKEEARLDLIGATCDKTVESGTLIDIGGGSTELVSIDHNKAREMVSIDMGCMSSYSQFVEHIFPTKQEQQALAQAFSKRLGTHDDRYTSDILYGVGGSIRGACKLKGALSDKPKSAKVLTRKDITKMLKLLNHDENTYAHAVAQAIPDRIHTISCALVIIDTLMNKLDASKIIMCKHGVREGYLIDRVLQG